MNCFTKISYDKLLVVIGYLYLESQSQFAKIVKQLDLDHLKLEFNMNVWYKRFHYWNHLFYNCGTQLIWIVRSSIQTIHVEFQYDDQILMVDSFHSH